MKKIFQELDGRRVEMNRMRGIIRYSPLSGEIHFYPDRDQEKYQKERERLGDDFSIDFTNDDEEINRIWLGTKSFMKGE